MPKGAVCIVQLDPESDDPIAAAWVRKDHGGTIARPKKHLIEAVWAFFDETMEAHERDRKKRGLTVSSGGAAGPSRAKGSRARKRARK